jgi:hypothetical protein
MIITSEWTIHLEDCDQKILLKIVCNNIQDSKTRKIAPETSTKQQVITCEWTL